MNDRARHAVKDGVYFGIVVCDDDAFSSYGYSEVSGPPPLSIEDFREVTSVKKVDFMLALLASGLIPDEEVEAAGMGAWPQSLAEHLPGVMSDVGAISVSEVKVIWSSTDGRIDRLNPIIVSLGTRMGLTLDQVDELFGIAPQVT